MTLSSRHRIRNSSPGGLRPSTLPLGHGGSPQYWLSHVDGEETFFVSFKPSRPETEPWTLAWKAAVLTTTLGPPPRGLSMAEPVYRPCCWRHIQLSWIRWWPFSICNACNLRDTDGGHFKFQRLWLCGFCVESVVGYFKIAATWHSNYDHFEIVGACNSENSDGGHVEFYRCQLCGLHDFLCRTRWCPFWIWIIKSYTIFFV